MGPAVGLSARRRVNRRCPVSAVGVVRRYSAFSAQNFEHDLRNNIREYASDRPALKRA